MELKTYAVIYHWAGEDVDLMHITTLDAEAAETRAREILNATEYGDSEYYLDMILDSNLQIVARL